MAIERFVYKTGTGSIATGTSTFTGTGTAWAGRDREGSQIWYIPGDAAPVRVGVVAAVEPRGIYENTSLPLVSQWNGPTLTNVAYELIDGPAIANGVTQASIYARFAEFIKSTFGLAGDTSDEVEDWDLVPENTLFVDRVSRLIYQWREGLLNPVYTVGIAFNPMGEYDEAETYSLNDLVSSGGYLFISNLEGNTGNFPGSSPTPSSDEFWTYYPTPGIAQVLSELGITRVVVSPDTPTGEVDGTLWLRVS